MLSIYLSIFRTKVKEREIDIYLHVIYATFHLLYSCVKKICFSITQTHPKKEESKRTLWKKSLLKLYNQCHLHVTLNRIIINIVIIAIIKYGVNKCNNSPVAWTFSIVWIFSIFFQSFRCCSFLLFHSKRICIHIYLLFALEPKKWQCKFF